MFDSSALAKGGSLDNISTKRNEDEDDEDDMHDYEYIDEDQLDNIRKTKPSNTI